MMWQYAATKRNELTGLIAHALDIKHYNLGTIYLVEHPTATPENIKQYLTFGAHAQEGYSSLFVCVSRQSLKYTPFVLDYKYTRGILSTLYIAYLHCVFSTMSH